MAPAPRPTVAVLAMPGSVASVTYGMYDLFRAAGRDWPAMTGGEPGDAALAPLVVARNTDWLQMLNEIVVRPQACFNDIAVPDLVCIPDLALLPHAMSLDDYAPEIAWLQYCYQHGATIASACTGALLLAETGLLDGHDATTHWAYCDALSQRHPTVRMHPQRVLVCSGESQRLVMGGGGTSWLDLTLYLIARLAGVECAMRTARVYLIDWHSTGQQPYAQLARSRQSEDAVIARSQSWIASHYEHAAPVAGMVRESGLAERTFKRRFQQATGLSPLEYVHTLRLEEAKHLLETGEEPVESVANSVGYEDAGFFSRLFKRKVGLSPPQYRRRFSAMRRMLQATG